MSQNITIADVAEALGVSKTTVSRAISGKGRIGEATRARVLAYIEEHDYRPNVIAKGLAQSKTFNLGIVMPGDYALVDLSFFQEVILGIQEIATIMEYDLLLCVCQEKDISSLERIVSHGKVDGIILLRTYLKDSQIELLNKKKIPFVAVGSTEYEGVIQIDHDHEAACKELTSLVLMQQNKKVALLGGNEHIVVTKRRLQGFMDAFAEQKKEVEKEFIYMNLESKATIEKAVEEVIAKDCDTILCMDDGICGHVLRKLKQMDVSVPKDIRIASYYNSKVLENNLPGITSLDFDARELGMMTCKTLISLIREEDVPLRNLLQYQIVLRESTK